MDIVIDVGNTSAKVGIVENYSLLETLVFDSQNINKEKLEQIFKSTMPERVCYLNVRPLDKEIVQLFQKYSKTIIEFNHTLNLSFHTHYQPVDAIGLDRLAGVLGAVSLYPEQDLLVIQAGTCITYDLYIKDRGHMGGAISPGINIRNRGMNTFTHQLPLVTTEEEDVNEVISNNTTGSLRSGILNGALYEIEGFIQHCRHHYSDLKVILSGGDMINFVKKIKSKIFANSNITLHGLIEILKLNEQTKHL